MCEVCRHLNDNKEKGCPQKTPLLDGLFNLRSYTKQFKEAIRHSPS